LPPSLLYLLWRSPDPYTTQSNHEPNEPWLKWMVQTGREKCSPALFTISYADNESSCTHKWAHRANIELMKMGVRGISVFAATGDEGVGGAWVEDCKGALLGTWPAGSPYITAVGGTRRHVEVQGEGGNLAPKCKPGFVSYVNAIVPPHDSPAEPKVPPPVCLKEFEYGSTQSAGGFSWFFKRPKYQRAAVGHFLKAHKDKLPAQHGTYARRFNWRHGRAYPDLCAFSEGNVMLYGDKSQNGDGTSASTPLTAGIFALLNDARKKAGKPPLGFVNPLIYQNPQAFRDITSGTNPGCGIPGFQCTPGWDPVTGAPPPARSEPPLAASRARLRRHRCRRSPPARLRCSVLAQAWARRCTTNSSRWSRS
jgi:tripeptidyl-peptidase I